MFFILDAQPSQPCKTDLCTTGEYRNHSIFLTEVCRKRLVPFYKFQAYGQFSLALRPYFARPCPASFLTFSNFIFADIESILNMSPTV